MLACISLFLMLFIKPLVKNFRICGEAIRKSRVFKLTLTPSI